ncbi:MAG TPA: hypothetical protein VGF15_00505 [Solirubrobacteraceae bacterium]|jgi:hypothetical protein
MSDPAKPKPKRPPEPPAREVLTSLPAHRPQRVTARRAATRNAPEPARTPSTAPGKPVQQRRAKPASAPAKRTSPKPTSAVRHAAGIEERVAPKQGFESDEIMPGVSVKPPSAPQMLGSALELTASVAQGALSRGGRLLLGALERLPRI